MSEIYELLLSVLGRIRFKGGRSMFWIDLKYWYKGKFCLDLKFKFLLIFSVLIVIVLCEMN